MSKEKKKPVSDQKTGEIRTEQVFEFGASIDERFIDGLYYHGMVKMLKRYLENPASLEDPVTEEDIKQPPMTPKQAKIAAKRKKKLERKNRRGA